jgi:hypothetical protein
MLHRVAMLLFHPIRSLPKHLTCRRRHVLGSRNSYPSKLKPKVLIAYITLRDLVRRSSADLIDKNTTLLIHGLLPSIIDLLNC